jgi:vacuolar protein sorting-associated protein 13B
MDCKLLECRNVTMQSVVKPFSIFGQIAVSSDAMEKMLDCTLRVDSLFVNFGQHVVHSLSTAIQAWQQVRTFQNSLAAHDLLLGTV